MPQRVETKGVSEATTGATGVGISPSIRSLPYERVGQVLPCPGSIGFGNGQMLETGARPLGQFGMGELGEGCWQGRIRNMFSFPTDEIDAMPDIRSSAPLPARLVTMQAVCTTARYCLAFASWWHTMSSSERVKQSSQTIVGWLCRRGKVTLY